jgi:3-oxoacyl-[acyl-carrier protein] reductase
MDLGLTGNGRWCWRRRAGSGLGMAEAIAAEGGDVMITGRSRDRLEAACAAINERGAGTARFVVSDLADTATPAMLEETVK